MIGLAGLATAQATAVRAAAQLAGAVEAWRKAVGAGPERGERSVYERTVARAKEALGEEAFSAALAAGQKLTLAEAAALAPGEEA